MFFEPNELGLFFKEESNEEKVLVMYTYDSISNPFENPSEIF